MLEVFAQSVGLVFQGSRVCCVSTVTVGTVECAIIVVGFVFVFAALCTRFLVARSMQRPPALYERKPVGGGFYESRPRVTHAVPHSIAQLARQSRHTSLGLPHAAGDCPRQPISREMKTRIELH
ncbi:uncharacterized protein LOC142588765 [Dermacentor variabilis]|uniref:uncharacterized protein LOC142588765 n=1 Tax=Dermacentor variabilis TaxID=34621 RepID=UPI003F5B7ADA